MGTRTALNYYKMADLTIHSWDSPRMQFTKTAIMMAQACGHHVW